MSAALIIMLRQQQTVDRFRDAGAVTPSAAKSLDAIGVTPSLMFSRLSRGGVFQRTDDGRWWFDAASWNRYRDRQWKRLVVGALVIIAVSGLGVLALFLR